MRESEMFPGLPDYGERRNRCATCGFLSKRPLQGGADPFLEVDQEERNAGSVEAWDGGLARPFCFVGAADLYGEMGGTYRANEELDQLRVRSVLGQERDGKHWWPWTPNISPKEHWEQRNVLYLEEERRKFEQRMRSVERRQGWALIGLAVLGLVLTAATLYPAEVRSFLAEIVNWFTTL